MSVEILIYSPSVDLAWLCPITLHPSATLDHLCPSTLSPSEIPDIFVSKSSGPLNRDCLSFRAKTANQTHPRWFFLLWIENFLIPLPHHPNGPFWLLLPSFYPVRLIRIPRLNPSSGSSRLFIFMRKLCERERKNLGTMERFILPISFNQRIL